MSIVVVVDLLRYIEPSLRRFENLNPKVSYLPSSHLLTEVAFVIV